MYNDQLVYKVVIWAFFGIRLWKDKEALTPKKEYSPVFLTLMTQKLKNMW